MEDLINAKHILDSGNYTAVLCRNEQVFTSTLRGVKPLVLWVEEKVDFSGFSAADKVVGKATAFLYLLLGVRSIFAKIISRPALQVLEAQGVTVEYSHLVENIINRQGSGICPFEEQVLTLTDKYDAYQAIRAKMEQMNITL
ncbi:MAG: DUF1893 domain-containing protein [Oscillospiraceae bacterium]|nr:DUF1893 domain-containing protein [Oscillospiraceae bacterium]